jgi:DNA polymerase-3 subunit chi
MLDVVFYVLHSSDDASRDKFIAKLIKKILQENRQADILFNDLANAQRFDLALWNLQPHEFIPHAIAQEAPAPIQLWGNKIDQNNGDVLLNLHPEFQEKFNKYKRTIEVLDQSSHLIQTGRQRFKQYRSQGIEPVVHKIGYPK